MFSHRIIIILLSCLIAGSSLPTQYSLSSNQIRYAAQGWPNKGYVDIRYGSDGSFFAGTNNGLGKIDALPLNLSESAIEDNLYKIIDSNLPQGGNPVVKTYKLNDDSMLIIVSGITSIDDPDGNCGAVDDSGNPYCQIGTGISWSLDNGNTWQHMDQPLVAGNNEHTCDFNNQVTCFDATWNGQVYEHGVYRGLYSEERVANVTFDVAADIRDNYNYIYAASWYGLLKRFKYTDTNPEWESVPLPRDSEYTLNCNDFPPEDYYYGPAFDDNHRPFSVEILDGYIWVGGSGINKGEIIDEYCINWTRYTKESTLQNSGNYNFMLPSNWITGIHFQTLDTGLRIWTVNWSDPIGAHHLSYTDDYGETWVREPHFSNDESIRAVVYNLYSFDDSGDEIENKLYASTSKGLFRFLGLNDWEKEEIANDQIFDQIGIINENDANFEVRATIIDENNNFLIGTTEGLLVRDAFSQFYYPSYIDEVLSGILNEMLVFPNPYLLDNHNHATFLIESSNNGKLEIYDFSMSKVFETECELANQFLDCKWFGLNNNGDRVANGIYFCKVQTRGKTYWEKLGVVKSK